MVWPSLRTRFEKTWANPICDKPLRVRCDNTGMSKTPVRTEPERVPEESLIRDYLAKLRERAGGYGATVEEARRHIDRTAYNGSLTEALYKTRKDKDGGSV